MWVLAAESKETSMLPLTHFQATFITEFFGFQRLRTCFNGYSQACGNVAFS